MKRLIVILLILLLSTVACKRANTEMPNNTFNPKESKIGDTVAGMKVVELQVGEDAPNYSVFAVFKGKATVKGKFVQYEGHDFLGDAIAFEVEEDNSDRLPRLSYDERNAWFVFINREEAIKLLEEYDYEEVTIEIDDYTINYAPTEVVNEASIVRVMEGSKKVNTAPIKTDKEIVDLNFRPQPITKLSYMSYSENWKSIGSKAIKNISGLSEVLINFYNINEYETRLVLQDKNGFVDLGMSFEGDIDGVTLLSTDVNNTGGQELVIMINKGATYMEVNVYDYDGTGWRCILESENIIIVDIDNDGLPNLVTTSMGSLPPYVFLYRWDGYQFLKCDIAADVGSLYVALSLTEEGKNIIHAGDQNSFKLYEYYDGRLYELEQ